MKFRPSFNKPPLRSWQLAGNKFNGIEAEHTEVFLIVRMEVRRVMDGASFHEHADDDAEEPADLGHGSVYARRSA